MHTKLNQLISCFQFSIFTLDCCSIFVALYLVQRAISITPIAFFFGGLNISNYSRVLFSMEDIEKQ